MARPRPSRLQGGRVSTRIRGTLAAKWVRARAPGSPHGPLPARGVAEGVELRASSTPRRSPRISTPSATPRAVSSDAPAKGRVVGGERETRRGGRA